MNTLYLSAAAAYYGYKIINRWREGVAIKADQREIMAVNNLEGPRKKPLKIKLRLAAEKAAPSILAYSERLSASLLQILVSNFEEKFALQVSEIFTRTLK